MKTYTKINGQDGHNTRPWVGVTMSIFACVFLGCSPFAKLEAVLVNDELAQNGEWAKVRIVREQEDLETTMSMAIQKGDRILTDANSKALIVADNWEAVVFPDSDVEVLNPSLFVALGAVLIKKIGDLKDTFKVKNEYVTAATEGTEFLVEVMRHETEITVVSGSVRLDFPTDTKESLVVESRSQASVTTNESGGGVTSAVFPANTAKLDRIRQWQTDANRILRPSVPELRNLKIEQARNTLRRIGLDIKEREHITGRVEAGVVYDQNPDAGRTVEIGETVTVNVEGESVEVPNLIGLPLTQAQSTATKAGLKIRKVDRELRSEGEAETVFSQSQSPGTLVPPGTNLILKVVEPAATVPNLVGMNRNTAVQRLKREGLAQGRVSEVDSDQQKAGTVIKQSPSAGRLVKKGSAVDLSVTVAPPMCDLPNVRGMSQQEAETLLKRAGFKVNIRIGEEEGNGVKEQSPGPGSVRCGSTVTLTVLVIK